MLLGRVIRIRSPCADGGPWANAAYSGRRHTRAENQLRVVAVGRNNWLFAGSFEGARRAALLYSLVQSCKLVDVSPFDYLKDVILRVATHPQRLVGQLTPKGWAATFARSAAA